MTPPLPYYIVGGAEELLPIKIFDIQSRIVHKIVGYYPNNPVTFVSLSDMRMKLTNMVGMVRAAAAYVNPYFVTLSSLYYPNADNEISVTRMVDSTLNKLDITPRPGNHSISEQIDCVMKAAGERPIIVVDDTLFHGETLEKLIAKGLKVTAAVEYFTKIETVKKLAQIGIEVFSVVSLDDYIDVMPVHDFLPGLPLCGKLLGMKNGNGYEPVMNGLSASFPYLYPYVPAPTVAQWASIPEHSVHEFSAFAITQTIIIAERLHECGIMTHADLAYAMGHHVSIPYLHGIALHPDMELHDTLARALYLAMT